MHAGSNIQTATATNSGFTTYPTCKITLFRYKHRFPNRAMRPPRTPIRLKACFDREKENQMGPPVTCKYRFANSSYFVEEHANE